jgi:hypothetical protein
VLAIIEFYEEVLIKKEFLLEDTFELMQSVLFDLNRILHWGCNLPFKSLNKFLNFSTQMHLECLENCQREGIVAGVQRVVRRLSIVLAGLLQTPEEHYLLGK